MTTTERTKTKTRSTERSLDRVVQVIGLGWVLVGLYYFTSTPQLDPALIRTWIIIQLVLGVTSLVLSVRSRR